MFHVEQLGWKGSIKPNPTAKVHGNWLPTVEEG